MKRIITLLLIIAAGIFNCSAQAPKFITVKGKEVIGADGKPFLMRGTNLGNWLVPEGYMFKFKKINSPRMINEALTELVGPEEMKLFWRKFQDTYVTEADIKFLKASGMNSIRIPFNYKLFTYEDYMGQNNPNRGFELLDRVIGWCKKANLYVILDMHCAPGGQTGDNIDDGNGYPFLFTSASSRKLTADIWHKIAGHYKNETIIMGYDLLNEPIAHYFKVDELNPHLEPTFKQITAAVRSVDKNHIVFLGGAQWDSNFKPFGKPFDSKSVYTFHKYWTEPVQKVIQDYMDFRDKYNVPIYVGETGENEDAWVKDFRILCEKNRIGWHYWPYKKLDNLKGIMSFNVPDGYEDIINYTEAPRGTFEEIRKAAPADREKIRKALWAFLESSKFVNCIPNKGYIEALGLKVPVE
ncbi:MULTISPECIES: glycoside hydrolase family 5 protein [unclassified Mucilaginibacter]|uniref:glycoside hydrolase family 5 protein n=2 Tax=Mucilaginibacter TaxID=423349 RepID=UPI002AC9E3B6|nr:MULTISPECIES: cellulase family glycosylhydrolase [unclassified Mucilaginibacter]MEB0260914.1 cellulase family glycosylhydrolase [Mucilaginibacter sp. 10I4]MEB0279849.1 cellulase family glycosylhydrolase [Mucilaginibacter sp. 10B2]WPX24180.1 cellulase family glycosylhydrolase [Mucilaginibacter sp. 5C4]